MINVLSICDSAEILRVFKSLKLVLGIIRVAGPILLLLSLSLDFFKATAENDAKAMKQAYNGAIRKSLAAIFLFFVPNFISIMVNISSGDETYKTCLANATTENINAAYVERAERFITMAKNSYSNDNYMQAVSAINKISDGNTKKQYVDQLKDVETALAAKQLVDQLRLSRDRNDYSKAEAAVNKINDEKTKKKLMDELDKIAGSMQTNYGDYSSYSGTSGSVENPLGIPYYAQCDSKWGNIVYDTGGATLCSSSCGYTSFAMVAAGLNRNMTINPVSVVSHMRNIDISAGKKTSRGYGAASTGELTSTSNMNYYGLTVSRISGTQSILNALNKNSAVIILVPGHYMVLAPSDKSGYVTLLDPFINWASPAKKSGTKTIEEIVAAYGNIQWAAAYSKK